MKPKSRPAPDVKHILNEIAIEIAICKKQYYELKNFKNPTLRDGQSISNKLKQLEQRLKNLEEERQVSMQCSGKEISFPHQLWCEAGFFREAFDFKEAIAMGKLEKAQDHIIQLLNYYYKSPQKQVQCTLTPNDHIIQEILRLVTDFLTISLKEDNIKEIEYFKNARIFYHIGFILKDFIKNDSSKTSIRYIETVFLSFTYFAYKFIKLAMNHFFILKEKQPDILETISGVAFTTIFLFLFTKRPISVKYKNFFLYCANVSHFLIEENISPAAIFSQERIKFFQDKWNKTLIEHEKKEEKAQIIIQEPLAQEETFEILKKKLEEVKKRSLLLEDNRLDLNNRHTDLLDSGRIAYNFLNNLDLFEEKDKEIVKQTCHEIFFYSGCILSKKYLKVKVVELANAYTYWENADNYRKILPSIPDPMSQKFLGLTFDLGKAYIFKATDPQERSIKNIFSFLAKGMNLLSAFQAEIKNIRFLNRDFPFPSQEEIKELFGKILSDCPKIIYQFVAAQVQEAKSFINSQKSPVILQDMSNKLKTFLVFFKQNDLFPDLKKKDKDFFKNSCDILDNLSKKSEGNLGTIIEKLELILKIYEESEKVEDDKEDKENIKNKPSERKEEEISSLLPAPASKTESNSFSLIYWRVYWDSERGCLHGLKPQAESKDIKPDFATISDLNFFTPQLYQHLHESAEEIMSYIIAQYSLLFSSIGNQWLMNLPISSQRESRIIYLSKQDALEKIKFLKLEIQNLTSQFMMAIYICQLLLDNIQWGSLHTPTVQNGEPCFPVYWHTEQKQYVCSLANENNIQELQADFLKVLMQPSSKEINQENFNHIISVYHQILKCIVQRGFNILKSLPEQKSRGPISLRTPQAIFRQLNILEENTQRLSQEARFMENIKKLLQNYIEIIMTAAPALFENLSAPLSTKQNSVSYFPVYWNAKTEQFVCILPSSENNSGKPFHQMICLGEQLGQFTSLPKSALLQQDRTLVRYCFFTSVPRIPSSSVSPDISPKPSAGKKRLLNLKQAEPVISEPRALK